MNRVTGALGAGAVALALATGGVYLVGGTPWLLIWGSGLGLVGLVLGVGWLAAHRARFRRNHALVKWRAPKRVYLAWASLLAVASATVVMAQALDRNLPADTWRWVHSSRLQLNAALALASLSFAEALRRLYRRVSAGGESDMRKKVRNHLGTAIANVSTTTGIPPGELGCGLFMIRRHWFSEETLERVERMRLLDSIPDSLTRYVKGKGTVGKCWQLNKMQHHSWMQVNRRWSEDPPSEDRWERCQPTTKHGFTHGEWTTMLGRYAEILAVPVTVSGTLVGVLALDRQWRRDASDSVEKLKSAYVEDAVGAVARALEPVLTPGQG